MTGLEHADHRAAASPRRPPPPPRLALAGAAPHGRCPRGADRGAARDGDAWLAARELSLHRERDGPARRLAVLGPQVLEVPDVEAVRGELLRLVDDLERHRQHLNDLVYDSVSLELGGSE